MVDWVKFTTNMKRLAAVMGTSFSAACQGAVAAMNAFGSTLQGTVWTVDVETATHDDLKVGNTTTSISRVQVLAPDETEAKLVACQMAATGGRIPTRATVVTPEELERTRQVTAGYRADQPPSPRLDNPLSHAVRVRRLEP